ncbi:isopenicillin-N epimerase [Cryobacterium flavum]|uniref:Aminotransferase class V-fold PLP-dependent enzyme n=1 Tax=Cryobacterium flavum TaxID=1424659 RepID=A0A4R8VEU7_9MICO|nr:MULTISPECIES: aminotransferase class V-fold PLP-dependent enzyme [Cryobacterium]TFB81066.1 aminotransferase class V-fold PLP-dependent enzyme [Cryobacterium flavum]SDM77810.1 isopenicillin-N epimerase [Cryobacterium flavum]
MLTSPVAPPRGLTLSDGRPARAAWSLDPRTIHINHGSFGAVPVVAQEHQNQLRAQMDANPVAWFPALPAMVKSTRREVAKFLGVSENDTALVPNASAGASVVFSSLPAKIGLEIVVTDHGYGAVTMGAERLARRWNGTVRTAHIPLDATAAEAYEAIVAELSAATGLIIVDHISSPTARFLPVQSVAREARRRGIPLLVDGAHVPGLYEDPLNKLDCDFWIGNLHKFGCAPRGTSVLVARGPLAAELYPLIDSWGATEPFPDRFDTQGTLDLTSYLATTTALDFIGRTWGWDAVRTYMSDLADYAEETITAAFGAITGEDHHVDVGMPVNALRLVRLPDGIATTHDEADALRDRVLRELGVEGAFTSFGGIGYFRLSVHVYNTAADFDYFVEHCVAALTEWAQVPSATPSS